MKLNIKTVDEILQEQELFNTVKGFISWTNELLFEKKNLDNAERTLSLLAKELLPIMGYEKLNRLLNYAIVADELSCAKILRYAYMVGNSKKELKDEELKVFLAYECKIKNIIKGLTQTIADTNIIKICSHCSKMMLMGYVFDNGQNYYCSESCLGMQDDTWRKSAEEDNLLYFAKGFKWLEKFLIEI